VRVDSLGAIERCGVVLSDEQRAALGSIDWTLSDEELAGRASQLPI
jgi:hypothetical protein